MWPPCSFCGDPCYDLAADAGIHPCCAQAQANEAATCVACDMARADTREPRELRPDVIPVEEWDWDEIHRLEKTARRRLAKCPRCGSCTHPMVCGQVGDHFVCVGGP